MKRSASLPVILGIALLLATAPAFAHPASLDPLAHQEQIVLGAPD
jgi:hypothetical protein